MLKHPAEKYQPYHPLNVSDRRWPSRRIHQHPVWVSTDLRDGNQAISKPMSIPQKLALFQLLVDRGFKQIEIAFPSASDTEYGFVQALIAGNHIPDDVWIQVMSPLKKENIVRTLEATRGAKHVMLQLYSATSHLFRRIIYQSNNDDTISLAVEHTHIARLLTLQYSTIYGTEYQLVYGLEGFSQSELTFVIDLCSAVKNAWESHGIDSHPIVFNLAATVECAPANHFADQVEYMHGNLPKRNESILSVHVHNDRGTAVAATELALLAGAERVEGCLFGNGERTGNVDLVTLALNLYSQGIPPGLNLSNLDELVQFMTKCNGIPVHPRHPYAGELVYTAFSGGHQDGIRKGFDFMEKQRMENKSSHEIALWKVPYLPVDPSDLGRAYEARVNSQSGKAGPHHIIQQYMELYLPRPMQIKLSHIVQMICDSEAREFSTAEVCLKFAQIFHFNEQAEAPSTTENLYLQSWAVQHAIVNLSIIVNGTLLQIHSCPENQITGHLLPKLNEKLGLRLELLEEQQQATSKGIASLIKLGQSQFRSGAQEWWGGGRAQHQAEATARAIISTINCILGDSMLDNDQ
ncbi:hypothetical protein C8J55DRAFT_479546 [Lentinula edodes]|uniref:2-isopropylmalate synthase n=1 Tax=Lentinula lateritia TaxID=40482 RepID=A0A9W8ZZX4_9AGAR|nr:hypothetical protein C8J55DRAFT_479546 [Lentinula edodes]